MSLAVQPCSWHAGNSEEERKANYEEVVNSYYDLATDFYEYGWGQSFHFACQREVRS